MKKEKTRLLAEKRKKYLIYEGERKQEKLRKKMVLNQAKIVMIDNRINGTTSTIIRPL